MILPMPADPAERDRYWREVVVPRIAVAKALREAAVVGREDLVSRVEAVLFDDDPIGINFMEQSDEYRPEAQTIVARLPEAASQDDVQRIVHEEFISWFDLDLAGPVERYRAVAEIIRGMWTAGARGGGQAPA